jgi:hypothetical protein
MQARHEERSLGELFSDLSQEFSNLLHQEVTLAKTEMKQNVSNASKNVGFIAGGGLVAFVGFMALVTAAIAALAIAVPLWLSALIIGIIVAVVGYVVLQRGLSALKTANLAPQQTIDTLKEDASWMHEQTQ